jgi:DNA-binding beta-propeller fold protein YncE
MVLFAWSVATLLTQPVQGQARLTASDSGAVMFERAGRLLQEGHKDKALDWLRRVVALHQGYDPSGDARWAPLFDDARFQRLVTEIHATVPVVRRSKRAFTITESDLIPDGLGYDSTEDVFYLGSMAKRKIVKIRRDGSVSDFIGPRDGGIFRVGSGMRIDPRTRTLWATADEPDSTGVFHYDLRTGTLIQKYVISAQGQSHLFNDLIVNRRGDVFVTDTWGNRIYRIGHDTNRLELLAGDLTVPFANGIALSPDEAALYVTRSEGVVLIDLATGHGRLLSHPRDVTLAGIDGLYCVGSSLIAVQQGIGWPRVVRFQLNAEGGDEVVGMDVLEARNPLFFGWGATTGAIVGDTFYYVANTQIWRFVNDRIEAPEKLTPIQILKVKFR